MKKFTLLFLALITVIFGMAGCSSYASHYHAVGHVYSNDSDSAWISFIELEGTEVFKLKCQSSETARIRYSGKLETGSLTVYTDCGGTKTELFSLRSGDEITASSEALPADTVHVIIETGEKCLNGSVAFEIVSG